MSSSRPASAAETKERAGRVRPRVGGATALALGLAMVAATPTAADLPSATASWGGALRGDLLQTPALKAKRFARDLAALLPERLAHLVPEISGGHRPDGRVLQSPGEAPVALARLQDPEAGLLGRAAPSSAQEPDEILQFGAMRIPSRIVATIVRAAHATGVDPVYMMALADKESSFSVGIKARTSSAEGLFQFISKTWLEVIRDFGARHGLAREAAAVRTVEDAPVVADEAMRRQILDLRRDPYISAVMAAELLKRDRARLEARLGRPLTPSEFYLAHFLGAESAGRFMESMDRRPRKSAPSMFPAAAQANRSLFYARRGRKTRGLTLAEVFGKVDRMIDHRLGRYSDVVSAFAPVPSSRN